MERLRYLMALLNADVHEENGEITFYEWYTRDGSCCRLIRSWVRRSGSPVAILTCDNHGMYTFLLDSPLIVEEVVRVIAGPIEK
jgi:hypothetical protein